MRFLTGTFFSYVGGTLVLPPCKWMLVAGNGGGDSNRWSVWTFDHSKFSENLPFEMEKFHSGSICAIPFETIKSDKYFGNRSDADILTFELTVTWNWNSWIFTHVYWLRNITYVFRYFLNRHDQWNIGLLIVNLFLR